MAPRPQPHPPIQLTKREGSPAPAERAQHASPRGPLWPAHGVLAYAALMSLIAARFAAASIGVLAFVGHLLVTFSVQPLTWRIEPPALGLAVGLVALVMSAAVPLMLYLWVLAPLRLRPASLSVDAAGSRFVAPVSPYAQGWLAVTLMWIGAGLVMTERVPNGDAMRVAHLPAAIPASLTAVTLAVGLAAGVLFANRPCVIMAPAGLTIRRLRQRSEINWDELAPGGPLPPTGRGTKQMTLYRKPPRPGTVPRAEKIPISWLQVSPGFLAVVIRHYAEQPAQRSGIGTQAELDRLHTIVAAQPFAEADRKS